jgi:hypothetical protein
MANKRSRLLWIALDCFHNDNNILVEKEKVVVVIMS